MQSEWCGRVQHIWLKDLAWIITTLVTAEEIVSYQFVTHFRTEEQLPQLKSTSQRQRNDWEFFAPTQHSYVMDHLKLSRACSGGWNKWTKTLFLSTHVVYWAVTSVQTCGLWKLKQEGVFNGQADVLPVWSLVLCDLLLSVLVWSPVLNECGWRKSLNNMNKTNR